MTKRPAKSLLKICCDRRFVEFFNGILFNKKLSWAERCVALAMLTVSEDKKVSVAKLARKFGTQTSSISKLKRDVVKKVKVYIHPTWR